MSKKTDNEIKKKTVNFSFQRTFAVAIRIINQYKRDRRTFALLLFVPIVIMLIFGLAFSGEVKDIPIVVDNQDVGFAVGPISLDFGQNITDFLIDDERVDVNEGLYDASTDLVESGDYYAVIYIPENFSETIYLLSTGNTIEVRITVFIDGTEPSIRASILGALHDALSEALGERGINVDQILAHGGAEFSGLDVSIPAVMGYVLSFLLLLVSLVTIIREKIMGTQDRLYSTPLTSVERLLGYVIGLITIASLMIGLVLIFGTVVFGTAVRGSFLLLIFAALLFGIAHVFLAVFLSNFAENEFQAIQFSPMIAIPCMAISGMLIPIPSLPNWLEPFSYITPLTYGINLFKGIMLKGWGFKELWVDFLVILGMAVLFFVLSVFTVRDRMKD
ncbi:MAG: ABC transporter permease [Candidatus Heimdallarchaeaceae archaeon]